MGDDARAVPISVLIPCYRSYNTVERAVNSVWEQTALPREVWLIDDATPDNGRMLEQLHKIQNRYAGEGLPVHVLACPRNIGPGEARNLAWKRAAQPYIALLDSDDAWHPQKLEMQYSWMAAHPEFWLCGHLDKTVSDGPTAHARFDTSAEIGWTEVGRRAILKRNVYATRTIMMRADVPFRFPENKRYSDDYFLWLEIVLGGFRAALLDLELAYQFRPPFSKGGFSDALLRMELGELDNYVRLFRAGQLGPLELATLAPLSIAKYVRRVGVNLRRQVRRPDSHGAPPNEP